MAGFSNIVRQLYLVAGNTLMKRRKLNPEGETFEATKTVESVKNTEAAKNMETVKTMARNIFTDVSVEIWHEIGSLLEPSDKAALALTCQASRACFGVEMLKTLNLPSQRVQRLKLLFRLHQQFPLHYLCAECCIYHLTANQTTYEATDVVLESCSTTPNLKWCVMSSIADDLRKGKCTVDDVSKRLGPGVAVALKKDRLFLSFACSIPMTIRTLQLGTDDRWRACKHLPTSAGLFKEVEKAICAVPRPWESVKAFKYESPAFRCPYCPTEFRVHSRIGEDKALISQTGARVDLILTRTLDLGPLLSPHERNWAALTRPRHAGLVETVPYNTGSNVSITKQFHTIRNWLGMSESTVLPLLD